MRDSEVRMRAGRRVALLVLTLVALFAPLAYADLPDQTWLGGFWDGGDKDDLTLQLESTTCAVETLPLCWVDPVLIVLGVTAPPLEPAVLPVTGSANQTRAPPVL
jgi:hypothetical protein